MKKIAEGAEAVIKADKKKVVKHRKKKTYRHPELDEALRKTRTRREAKVIKKLEEQGFPVPKLHDVCDKKMEIHMQLIEGSKVRDVLHENHIIYSEEMGKKIAELHAIDIIHGDLTTSNMMAVKHSSQIHFIDFGLSQFSDKPEDKAVDLHLFQRALESKHHKIWEECYNAAVKEYKKHYKDAKVVLERLKKVQKRGRYKKKSH